MPYMNKPETKRMRTISLRLTREEYDEVTKAAWADPKTRSVSEWLRDAAMAKLRAAQPKDSQ